MAKAKRAKRAAKPKVRAVYKGPLHLVHDPVSKVLVALLNDDKGTPEVLRKITEELRGFLEFADITVLPWPLKRVEVGANAYANRKRDLLDILHDNQSIGDCELLAGREFQGAFDVSNDIRIRSVNGERVSNSRVDIEGIAERRIRARDKVDAFLNCIGPQGSVPRAAVEYCIGYRTSFNAMIVAHGQNVGYWRAGLVSGLQTLAQHTVRGRKRKTVDK